MDAAKSLRLRARAWPDAALSGAEREKTEVEIERLLMGEEASRLEGWTESPKVLPAVSKEEGELAALSLDSNEAVSVELDGYVVP